MHRWLALGVALAFAACSHKQVSVEYGDPSSPALGKEKRITFEAAECTEHGCPLGALMLGTDYKVSLGNDPPEDIGGTSSAPDVLTLEILHQNIVVNGVEMHPPYLQVTAKGLGITELRITDSKGALLDRRDVEVRAAARVVFETIDPASYLRVATAKASLSLAAKNTSPTIYAVPLDAAGIRLGADKGFTFTPGDKTILRVEPCFICFGTSGDYVALNGVKAGSTSVDVTVTGTSVRASLPVDVMP